ncbi:succinate dehydrogenase cytochrome b552 subunit [Thermoplasma volcanium GSS1]|uniref:Succinate dehydrogenase cytochrome b552 subunit n=1 Tax=Thermoplasma volcanium (strain ATCC 51530 / DSM 4299 / JCM 9571 / NBRC 15438 / GSS1) TaxID=273116 RepID=Q97AU6_THEVO|nr:succinate dehydrogenase cytochrome b552 subunit [Thermoplasma volcanium GSS1]
MNSIFPHSALYFNFCLKSYQETPVMPFATCSFRIIPSMFKSSTTTVYANLVIAVDTLCVKSFLVSLSFWYSSSILAICFLLFFTVFFLFSEFLLCPFNSLLLSLYAYRLFDAYAI